MQNFVSLTEDQIPLPIITPTNVQIPDFRPSVTDITLYGATELPFSNKVIQSGPSCAQKPLSFKDWKERQEVNSNFVPLSAFPERKQVRFNEPPPQNLQPNSMPQVPRTSELPPATQHRQQPQSLPTNLLLKPPICKDLELSIYDVRPKVFQGAPSEPLMQGLFQQANVGHLLHRTEAQSRPPFQSSVVPQCKCQFVKEKPSPAYSQNLVPETPQQANIDPFAVHEVKEQISAMQEQIRILQLQVTRLLQSQSPKPSPSKVDSATQYTYEPPIQRADAAVNTTQIPETDQTFFNHVLGTVNQILQQTDDTRLNSGAVKFIESDASVESIPGETTKKNNTTEKSMYVNELAQRYVGNVTSAAPETTGTDIDVSKTCYNYLKKYDLLKSRDKHHQNNLFSP